MKKLSLILILIICFALPIAGCDDEIVVLDEFNGLKFSCTGNGTPWTIEIENKTNSNKIVSRADFVIEHNKKSYDIYQMIFNSIETATVLVPANDNVTIRIYSYVFNDDSAVYLKYFGQYVYRLNN